MLNFEFFIAYGLNHGLWRALACSTQAKSAPFLL